MDSIEDFFPKERKVAIVPEELTPFGLFVIDSEIPITYLREYFGLRSQTLNNWMNGKTKPRKLSLATMESIMTTIKRADSIPKHPSFGYATQEQVEALNRLGIGPDRDYILSQIEKQNKQRGKILK